MLALIALKAIVSQSQTHYGLSVALEFVGLAGTQYNGMATKEGGQAVDKQYVCHISGQGEKWEVGSEYQESWRIHTNAYSPDLYLPKSEYRICDPPEVWRDVTELCEISRTGDVIRDGKFVLGSKGYRFRKVEVNLIGPNYQYGCKKAWAFIVEQKVTE